MRHQARKVTPFADLFRAEEIGEEEACAKILDALQSGPCTTRQLRLSLCGDRFPDSALYRYLGRLEVRGLVRQTGGVPAHWVRV